jgi:putative endonuclease
MSWLVYIIETESDTLYTGITNDLPKRLEKHRAGSGAKYLRAHPPRRVVYREPVRGKSEALKREAVIKKMTRTQKKGLIFRNRCYLGGQSVV